MGRFAVPKRVLWSLLAACGLTGMLLLAGLPWAHPGSSAGSALLPSRTAPPAGESSVALLASAPLTPTLTPTPLPWDDIRVNDLDIPTSVSAQSLALVGSNVYVVYQYSSSGIYLSRSTDGGRSFLPGELHVPHGEYVRPAIAARGPEVYIVCEGLRDVLLFRSLDSGRTWDERRITIEHPGCPPNRGCVWQPRIALAPAPGGPLYVAWKGQVNDIETRKIYLSRSTDGGGTWSPPQAVSPPADEAHGYALAAQGENVYLAVADEVNPPSVVTHVLVARSTDAGKSWGPFARVDRDPNRLTEKWPLSLALDPAGVVYVSWIDARHDEPAGQGGIVIPTTYVARSTDGGATWSWPARVDDGNCVDIASVSLGRLAYDEQAAALYVALQDNRLYCPSLPFEADVFLGVSATGGVSWAPNEKVNNPSPHYVVWYGPIVAAQEGVAYTVWTEGVPSRVWLDIHDTGLPPRTLTPTPTVAPLAPAATPTAVPLVPGRWGVYVPWVERR